MRRPFIAGNWKMFKTIPETVEYIKEFSRLIEGAKDRDVLLGVPFTSLFHAVEAVQGVEIKIAAENCHWEKSGAFTGEISVEMIKATGAGYVIVGHSERRQFFGETDETVNKKVRAVLDWGLIPIMCIGETKEERESERTFSVLDAQLTGGLAGLNGADMASVIVAYEPVWAIGTGLTATPEQAEEVHKYIRGKIAGVFNETIANDKIILYGGSVKAGNIDALMAQPDIDGGLVGGASLKAEDFAAIVNFRMPA